METKQISVEEARLRLMNYCSRYETCTGKVVQKLRQWQISQQEQQDILDYLTAHNFLNDARYTDSFVRTKMAAKWGKLKIRMHLQLNGIAKEIIDQAMSSVDATEESSALDALLQKKIAHTKAKSPLDLKAKLLRFAVSRGYSYSTAAAAVGKVLDNSNNSIA